MLTKPVTIGDLLVPEVPPLSPESEIFLGLGTSEEKMIANTLTLNSVRWDKVQTTVLGKLRSITWDCTETWEIPTFHRAQRTEIQFVFERKYQRGKTKHTKPKKCSKVTSQKSLSWQGELDSGKLDEGGLEKSLLPVADCLMELMGALAEPLPSSCSLAFTPFTGYPLAPKTFSEVANFHESKWGHFPPFFLISTRLVPQRAEKKGAFLLSSVQLSALNTMAICCCCWFPLLCKCTSSFSECFFPPHSIKRNITHLISCYHLFPSEISSSHFFGLLQASGN